MDRPLRDKFRDKKGFDEHGTEGDYYSEDTYSPWKKGNVDGLVSNISKHSGLLFVIIGAAVFILVALFVFLPRLQSPAADNKQVAEMESKIKKLEIRLGEMEQNYQKIANVAIHDDRLEQVSGRLDKLGSTTNHRLDQIAKELENIRKPQSQQKAEAPVKMLSQAQKPEVTSPAKPVAATEKTKTTGKYHEVKPQETLFGLSRLYGVSVEELRRLNKMAPTEMIRIGQRLKISD